MKDPRSRRLSLVAIVLLVAGIIVGVAYLRHSLEASQRRERLARCRQLSQAIASFRTKTLDGRIGEMQSLRLNDLQARTLRQADPAAYLKFSAEYQQKVEAAAEAAQELGRRVGELETSDCLAIPST
jgi:Na+-transporting NADH:ubiquinone oxidoreductase subunit NqrC